MTGAGPGIADLHMVWTRPIDGVPMAGRPNVARQIRSSLGEAGFRITQSIIRPITTKLTLARLLVVMKRFVTGLLHGRPIPLQCLLFGDEAEADRVLAELPIDCALVYLDGVRCLQVLEALRRRRPDLAILTDLDDLMSRRMALLLESGQAPSAGYLKSQMPGLVERLLAWRLPRRLILRYEAASLMLAEQRIAELSDCVALISRADAAILQDRVPDCDVRAITFAVADHCPQPRRIMPPYRFVFIGTDALRQNQLTIDVLLQLWRSERIPTPLVICGEQHRQYDLPPNASLAGYVDSLADIYDDHSILLSPSYLAGGVKTKVLEGFAYSTPVVGNATSFESINIDIDYPLLFETDAGLLPLLRAPGDFAEHFAKAITLGKSILRRDHDPAKVRRAWQDIADTALVRRGRSIAVAERTSGLAEPVVSSRDKLEPQSGQTVQ